MMEDDGWEDVPGGLAGPTFLKRKYFPNGDFLEMWDHPEWSPALVELKNGNKEPLRQLLLRGEPAPGDVARELGKMLCVTKEYKGARLEVRVPKRWTIANMQERLREMCEARREIEAERRRTGGKLEAAVSAVAMKRKACGKNHSRRYLMECHKVDDKEFVLRTLRMLGEVRR